MPRAAFPVSSDARKTPSEPRVLQLGVCLPSPLRNLSRAVRQNGANTSPCAFLFASIYIRHTSLDICACVFGCAERRENSAGLRDREVSLAKGTSVCGFWHSLARFLAFAVFAEHAQERSSFPRPARRCVCVGVSTRARDLDGVSVLDYREAAPVCVGDAGALEHAVAFRAWTIRI